MSWFSAEFWKKVFGRYKQFPFTRLDSQDLHTEPPLACRPDSADANIWKACSQTPQIHQTNVGASSAEHVGKVLRKRTVQTRSIAKKASRAAPLICGSHKPADRLSLAPAAPSDLQAELPAILPVEGCSWAILDNQNASWLNQQECSVAQAPQAPSTRTAYDGPRQTPENSVVCPQHTVQSSNQHSGVGSPMKQLTGTPPQVKLQLAVGTTRKSSKYALRPPSGRARKKPDTNTSLIVSRDCTAALHRATFQDTEEAFSLRSWCASVDTASVAPAHKDALKHIFASRKDSLKTIIAAQLAACHEQPTGTPYVSRKRRKVIPGT